MARRNLRLRVDDTGSLEVVDPGLDTLELLQAIDPGFREPSISGTPVVGTLGLAFSLDDVKTVKQDLQWDADTKNRLLDRWTKEIGSKR